MQTVARAPRVRNGIRSSLKYWINIDNQRKRLEEIGKELGVQHLDDWYKIPRTAVYTKLPFVTELYGHLFNALKAVYPQHNWDQIHFSWSNHGQWKDIDTQKKKLEQLAAELGVKTLDDWYNVSRKELYDRAPFIKLYHGCLFTALRTLYPQHNWNESKLSPSYWHSIEHQRKRLDEIGKELGVKQLDDWYSVSRFQLRRKAFFISQYYDSVFSALRAIYPQHPWDELKYSRKPWKMIEGRMKDVMDELMHRYDISALEHWQRVDMHEWRLIKNFAVARFRSVSAMFNSLFPSMATPSKYSKAEAVLQVAIYTITVHTYIYYIYCTYAHIYSQLCAEHAEGCNSSGVTSEHQRDVGGSVSTGAEDSGGVSRGSTLSAVLQRGSTHVTFIALNYNLCIY
jgi:hypothetical protein